MSKSSAKILGWNDAKPLFHLTRSSSNEKTGPIPVSTSPASTCPDSCPLKGNGCMVIGPFKWHWDKVSRGERGGAWEVFLDELRTLPRGQLWRHNQAGDLPGDNEEILPEFLKDLVNANQGRKGFTYTHKPVLSEQAGPVESNRAAIKEANAQGFTINLSANGLNHADKLAALGIGPVCTILPDQNPVNRVTPQGRKVVICPAQTRDNTTCASCGLCQRADRSVIVGFMPHGSQQKKALEIARAN
jgi:hypothetical protein